MMNESQTDLFSQFDQEKADQKDGESGKGNPAEKTAQRETSRRIEPLNPQAL